MYSVVLLIQTKLDKKNDVAAKLKTLEETSDVKEVYGKYDLVVRVDTEDQKTMEEFLKNKVRIIDDIKDVDELVISDSKLELDEESEVEEE